MFKKYLLALLTAVMVVVVSQAQDMVLSLDQCIQVALTDNPTIKVAEMEIKRVDYTHRATLGQLLPTVNFNGQYTRNLALQTIYMNTDQGTTAIKMGRDNTYAAGFTATLPIIAPTLWKSIKLTDNQILQNVEAARSSKLTLVNQVKNAYYALLLAHDSKRVIEESHATAKLNAEVYEKQFEQGTASEYDMLRAKVAVSNLEPTIIEAENTIERLELQLKVLMGMDVRVNFAPKQRLDDFKGAMYDHALMADTSLVGNSSLKSLDLQTDYLRRALEVQKMAWYPTLSGSINYQWNSMSMGNPFKNFNWTGSSAATLTLSVPLFQGGQRYYKQKAAEVSLREMRWQRENLERSLHTQVEIQMDNITRSLKQIESTEASVRQAVKANDIMQQSFQIGAATFLQLRDTEDALLTSRLSYYQAIYDFLVAECDLELLLGNNRYANQ